MRQFSSIESKVRELIKQRADKLMHLALIQDPFASTEHFCMKSPHARFVPLEIFKGSHFERIFCDVFRDLWGELALFAANKSLGYAISNYRITGSINRERLRRMHGILNSQAYYGNEKERRIQPNWDSELEYILSGKSKQLIPVSVICDIYAEDKGNNRRYAFELKAPLPNSDQTKVSKEKILKLYSMDPPQIDGAFYALPYNPYGHRKDYAWSFPDRWFDMKKDPVILIGDEFWEKIGGEGTYQAFIEAVNEIGPEYTNRIYRQYLGIEPPTSDEWKI